MKKVDQTVSRYARQHIMPATLVVMFDEHRYLNRLLDILQQEAMLLAGGRQADMAAISTIFDYIRRYPDCYHHPKENLLLDKLSTAVELRPLIAQLKWDHRQIDRQARALAALLSTDGHSRSRRRKRNIAASIGVYVDSLRQHMLLEESQLFALASQRLRKKDWQAIDKQIAVIDDPVFGAMPLDQYKLLFERYLNSFHSVSTGKLSPLIFEQTAAVLERTVATVFTVARLPKRIFKYHCGLASRQLDTLKSLRSVRDVATARNVLSRSFQLGLEGVMHSLQMVGNAIQLREPGSSAVKQVAGNPTVLPAIDPQQQFADFNSPAVEAGVDSQISWQALAVNLLLRATIKPWMTFADLDAAIKTRNTGFLRNKVPAGVNQQALQHRGFKARWVRLAGQTASQQTVLYLPGGAFFFPAVSAHTSILANLLKKTACQGLIVDYRLAPEHPFPAGLEDAIAAYQYLLQEQGIAAEDIVIAGDSAGGGLAVSLLLALRERHIPLPRAAALLSPLTDLSFSGASRHTNRWRDAMLPTRRRMQSFALYHGDLPASSPLLSPIFADLSDLPPLFIQVSSTEILLDDSLRLAHKARRQGVEVTVEVWQSLPHVWQLWSAMPEAEQALVRVGEFFNRQLGHTIRQTA